MPDGGHFKLSPDHAARLVANASTMGYVHALPLMRALGAGRIVVAFMPRGASDLDTRCLDDAGVPAVVVVQDDDHASTGPAGFPVARKALRWGRSHLFHGTGGQPEDYAFAVAMAEAHRSLVLVETSSAHALEWVDLGRRAAMPRRVPSLVLLPPPRGAHPVPPPIGARH